MKASTDKQLIAKNRRAPHLYAIEKTFEAGIVLCGTEVKSCRGGKVQLVDAYVTVRHGEAYLVAAHIGEYEMGNRFNHEPRRERKLLLHAREIAEIDAFIQKKSMSAVPMSVYLKGGRVKVEIGMGRGKDVRDKRRDIQDRDENRDLARTLRRHR